MRLVSYQRDLGVWMFPGVRRTWFLLAIVLMLNAVFVPLTNAYDLKTIKNKGKKLKKKVKKW